MTIDLHPRCWLKIKRAVLDWQNIPFANASISLDLCDSCLAEIIEAVNETAARIRNKDRKADAWNEE